VSRNKVPDAAACKRIAASRKRLTAPVSPVKLETPPAPLADDLPKRTMARLLVTARRCDHCGTVIQRWTSAGYYDARADRVYCSTGGCAKAWRDAPKCRVCKQQCNPFDTVGQEELAGGVHICRHCSFVPVTAPAPVKSKKGVPAGKEVEPERFGLTSAEAALVRDGPYVVQEWTPGFFRLVRPLPSGPPYVRSTGSDAKKLLLKCSEINRGGE
jgi:hypothetical protein